MPTKITFDNDSLAHYGVKGMRWGTRRLQAKVAGRVAARNHINSTNSVLSVQRNRATNKVKKLNSKWRGTEHEAAYEKAKQKEFRRQVKWKGTGYTAAKANGDATTRKIARKEEKHKTRMMARHLAVSAAASVIAVGGPIAYGAVKQKLATANNLKVRNMYNKYAKTGIYDIKL